MEFVKYEAFRQRPQAQEIKTKANKKIIKLNYEAKKLMKEFIQRFEDHRLSM